MGPSALTSGLAKAIGRLPLSVSLSLSLITSCWDHKLCAAVVELTNPVHGVTCGIDKVSGSFSLIFGDLKLF